MKYIARYSGRAYAAAIEDAAERTAADSYYGTGHNGPYGSGVEAPDDISWPAYRGLDDVRAIRAALLRCDAWKWVSCYGARLEYRFDHARRGVTLSVDSSRHAVVSDALARFVPDLVIEYQTSAPHWRWYETLDDRRAPGVPALREFGEISEEIWDSAAALQQAVVAARREADPDAWAEYLELYEATRPAPRPHGGDCSAARAAAAQFNGPVEVVRRPE